MSILLNNFSSKSVVTLLGKQLKRLVLKDCHWVTRASMEYMAHHQTSIITINLTGCWELVDKTIVQLLASFRQ